MLSTSSGRQEDSDGHEMNVLAGERLPDEEAQNEGDLTSRSQIDFQLQNDGGQRGTLDDLSPDEKARLWDEVEAETGFRSYVDYLKTYVGRDPSVRTLKYYLQSFSASKEGGESCAIYDVHVEGYHSPKITLQCSSSSAEVVLSALRRPSATPNVRILLWNHVDSNPYFIDAIGLGLRIQPSLFQKGYFKNSGDLNLLSRKIPSLASEIFLIGEYALTVARHYLPLNPDAPPVILIARFSKSLTREIGRLDEDIEGHIPFQKLTRTASEDSFHPRQGLSSWMQMYINLLESDLEKRKGPREKETDLIFKSLAILLQFNIFDIYQDYDVIRGEYLEKLKVNKEQQNEDLFEVRSDLRRSIEKSIEESEDMSQQLKQYVHEHKADDVSQKNLSAALDELQQVHLKAARLETEIRDFLQLQTGELALQESRKSIELSNSQIEEAKRG